jgi:Uma2 family endonuclease
MTEVLERKLSPAEMVARYLALDSDPRFLQFSGKIELNEFGDLLVNAASRFHVVVQKRLAAYLERNLGGEAMTEMPVQISLPDEGGVRLRVPDISWSSAPGFFDGPSDLKVLAKPAELCIEIKSDSNTLKDLREKRDELLAAGAREVWFAFPEHRRIEIYDATGQRATSSFGIELAGFWSEI